MIEYSNRQFRHELIKEFRHYLCGTVKLPVRTDAVMVLSHADSDENQARTEYAIEVYKRLIAQSIRINLHEVTKTQALEHGSLFVINCVHQAESMRKQALSADIPEEKIREVICPLGANTKTQFEIMPQDLLKTGLHLTLVSSGDHGPRVIRTADKILPADLDFTFIGRQGTPDVLPRARDEINKIIRYSEKGDISRYPTRNGF